MKLEGHIPPKRHSSSYEALLACPFDLFIDHKISGFFPEC
jgi:hypothetical protein